MKKMYFCRGARFIACSRREASSLSKDQFCEAIIQAACACSSIEDDPDLNRQRTTAAESRLGVDRAFDGEEGHFLGDSEPTDAVVLDIACPKMDGSRCWRHGAANGRAMPVLNHPPAPTAGATKVQGEGLRS